MRKIPIIIIVAIAGLFVTQAMAGTVPPITAADFAGMASESAHPIWLILAGQGALGVILAGIAGLLYTLVRPYILAWMAERKLTKLFLAVESFVSGANADFVEEAKARSKNGKLTVEDKNYIFGRVKQSLIIFMQSQGVDIIKEYGDVFIDGIIELIVSRLKLPKAVSIPLSSSPASAPLPPSVTDGAMPA